jgi:hypothetical protein
VSIPSQGCSACTGALCGLYGNDARKEVHTQVHLIQSRHISNAYTNLNRMPPIQAHIIRHLDQASASALAHTCRHFASLCAQVRSATMSQHRHQTISHTVARPSAPLSLSLSFTASSSSSASHCPRSIGADEDTDMTSPEEWDFRMTPEIVMRLSLVAQAKGAALPLLPTELQIQIFGYLDKIDSVCFGLTCPRSYEIYRAIYGTKMPLNTRRVGPNSLESAWEVVGKQECMQCGMFRCELWQHIKSTCSSPACKKEVIGLSMVSSPRRYIRITYHYFRETSKL